MKINNHRTNWWIDAVLFAGFILSFWLDVTGVGVHQWLGVAFGLLAGYHLLSHWGWVKTITQRFMHTSWQARLYYVVDAAIFLGAGVIMLSGLMISTWLGLALESYAAWRELHVDVSIFTLALTALKILLHWRWIAAVARRSIFEPAPWRTSQRPIQPALSQAAHSPVRSDRRDFLKLAGIVGAAAVVSLANAYDLPESGQAASTNSTGAVSSQPGAASSSSSAAGCTVRCNRGCSYPGHCRRYADSNGNNHCDLGECI